MPWPDTFPDKVAAGIDFMDEAVVQCYVPVIKILLQVLEIYKWSQVITGNYNYKWILMGTLCTFSGPTFGYSFSFLEDETYNLRSWLHEKELAG